VVEWLGKATVVALGADLLAACGDYGDYETTTLPGADCDDPQYPFAPNADDIGLYDSWKVRTVDPQQVAALASRWRLVVDGLVANPIELSFAELIELPRQDQVTDFHCVEGWSVLDVPWNGVHLSEIFRLVEPLEAATHATFTSFGDVYVESLPLDEALEPKTMLGYGVGCNTLPLDHGFPLRVVIPRKFGYKNAKTIQRIELTDHPVNGYWVERGYSYEADVQPERLRPGKH
jgi:DMSO/TMAO reductase YedYZ molybdopterin-dependent catalytic subunit